MNLLKLAQDESVRRDTAQALNDCGIILYQGFNMVSINILGWYLALPYPDKLRILPHICNGESQTHPVIRRKSNCHTTSDTD